MNYNTKSGVFGKPRYSSYGPPTESEYFESLNSSSSGSGTFDWGKLFNNLIDTGGNVISNIFGTGDKSLVNAQNQIINQQEKTMTILWVVIGLMAALGVVLLIRKTK